MKADALQLILDTCKQANAAEILNIETDGRTKFVRIGDGIHEIAIKPQPRKHKSLSLDALIGFVKNLSCVSDPENAVVWHGDDKIVLVPDNEDRRDNVTMSLTHTKRFLLLKQLEIHKEWHDQLMFVRMLRLDFGLDNIGVVAKFRRLAWADGSKTTGEFVHGADKMGRQINSQVENAADIPDELNVTIPVYEEFPKETLAVRCAVEIDSRNQQLQIVPMPGELKRVLTATQEMIHETLVHELADGGTAIYYGTP